ncbi:MAG: DNA translocase FtsK [Candidatus Promineifilaceae bacterium]
MAKHSADKNNPKSQPQTWDEWLVEYVSPYRWEILGAVLLFFALSTMLALPGLGDAGFLTGVVRASRRLLGWGAYVIFLSIGVLGVQLMVHQLGIRRKFRPKTLIATELLIFIGLPITHILTGATLSDAEVGRAGGLLGFALSDPLISFFGRFLTYGFYGVCLVCVVAMLRDWNLDNGIRWLVQLSGRLRRWSENAAIDPDDDPIRTVHAPSVALPPNNRRVRYQANRLNEAERLITPTVLYRPAVLRPKPKVERIIELPPLDLLDEGTRRNIAASDIQLSTKIIEKTLHDFGLAGSVVDIRSGPSLTQFGIEPGYLRQYDANGELIKKQKVRVAQIANLRKDFALALAVPRLRIEAPVPGRGIVGIEVPNPQKTTVRLYGVLDSAEFAKLKKPLAVGLGEDVAGVPEAIDLAKMPHLLIAGTTGSGKSVCMKTLITSLIMNNTPEQLRLILIDPKRVEMIRFNGLPHLLGHAEVEGDRIIGVLRWVLAEMDRRYGVFAELNARNLQSYNLKVPKKMPHIVVFIDELADLMVQYSAETERTLCRLAQMARATGIHLVVATQRPSTDVITGLIKANFPARIAFAVASSMDSRVVIDSVGAEQLLGSGDMLFLSSDASMPKRVQGCFVDDDEIDRVVDYWQAAYPDMVAADPPWQTLLARMRVIEDTDDEIEKAIELVKKYDRISTSFIQRKLRVGFPRAARIMEKLHEMDLVADPKKGGKTRRTRVSEKDHDPLGDFIDSKQDS